MSPIIMERYGLELPEYPGLEQVVELLVPEEEEEMGEGL